MKRGNSTIRKFKKGDKVTSPKHPNFGRGVVDARPTKLERGLVPVTWEGLEGLPCPSIFVKASDLVHAEKPNGDATAHTSVDISLDSELLKAAMEKQPNLRR